MMMCNPTKFGLKKMSSSIDTSETIIYLIIWALTVTLNLKTANLFSCMTLGSMMVHYPTKSVTKGSAVEEISLSWTFTGILNLSRDLDLDQTEQSYLFTRQSSSWLGAIKPIYFSCERISNSEDIKSSLVTWRLHCDLDLEDSKPIFLEDSLAHGDALPYRVW